jgi:hypothetical protein
MSGCPASGFTAGAAAAALEVAADAAADAPLAHGAGDAGALDPAAAEATAPGEAQLASAALLTCVSKPSVAATMAPTATASATGMATGTAMRAALLRRRADRCLVGMQSTSMS